MTGDFSGTTRSSRLPWIAGAVAVIAVAAAFVVPHGAVLAAGVLFALAVALVLARPQWALFIFIVGLPLHNFLMATLYAASGSATVVKVAQPWKEALLALALVRAFAPVALEWLRTRRWRLGLLDSLIVVFVVVCALSVVLPSPVIGLGGRVYGFRDLVVPLGAYAVGRMAPFSRREVKGLLAAFGFDALLFSVVAIGERAIWGHALYNAVNYSAYLHNFLKQGSPLPHNVPYTYYTSGWFPRTGSLALDPLDVSVLLLITLPVVVAVAGLAHGALSRRASVGLGLLVLLGSAALMLAFGRESLILFPLALLALVLVGGWRRFWPVVGLTACGLMLGGVLLVAAVSYGISTNNDHVRIAMANEGLARLAQLSPEQLPCGVGLPDSPPLNKSGGCGKGAKGNAAGVLFQASAGSDNASTAGHLQSLKYLGTLMLRRPMGYGIGAAGAVGDRFNTHIGGETSYLTVGVDLGVLGFLIYMGLFAGAVWNCWLLARTRQPLLERAVFLGVALSWTIIAVDGVFAEVTLNLFAMFVLWWLAGAATTRLRENRVVFAGNDAAGALRWQARRPLKVAMDVQALQTARTGVRTYLDEILKQFAVPDLPHQVVLLRGPKRLPSTKRLYRMINQMMYLLWLHFWLPVRLAAGNYDVLFSPEYITPFWVPCARVVEFYDAAFLRNQADYNKLWLLMFNRITMPAIRRADAVVVPSQHAAREIHEYGKIRQDRIIVVPLGGPSGNQLLQVDDAVAVDVCARFGVRPGGYIVHVGVLERRKNLPTLVEAFAMLVRQGLPAEVKLVLVGQKGPRPDLDDSARIHETVAHFGLDDRVIFTGHVGLEERNALYTRAAVVAIPSLLEGFGIPVLEAFAAQVPVVCSNVTSLPEVAGEAALFFDPTDPSQLAECLHRALTDAELRESLVAWGRERLALFTWERTSAETLTAFETAVIHEYAPSRPRSDAFIVDVSAADDGHPTPVREAVVTPARN